MLKEIILCGITLTLTLGIFLGMIFTNDVKNNKLRAIIVITLAIAIGFGTSALICDYEKKSEIRWNNGYCAECNIKLTPFGVRNGQYYYYCEKCKKIVEK